MTQHPCFPPAIWLAALGSAQEWEEFESLLDDGELSQLRAFQPPAARLQYLAGHAMVRLVLSAGTGVDPCAWRFRTDAFGKPYIALPDLGRGLFFNLSHADGLVACAVGAVAELGVDVERIERTGELAGLAAYALAPIERHRIAALDADAARDAFFTIWTLKEAYVKALGQGFTIPPDSFWIDWQNGEPCLGGRGEGMTQWRFQVWHPTPDHRLAFAQKGGDWPPCVYWTRPEALRAGNFPAPQPLFPARE